VVTVSGAASNGVNVVVPVLTGIVVGPQDASIAAGATIRYSATGTYSDGIDRLISSGTSWSSAVVAAATVASSGVATGVAQGQTTVQVTVGSISAGTLLTVLPSRFVATGRFRIARSGHLATLLEDGKVLMVAGLGTSSTPLTSAELYNPVSGAFGPAGGLGTTREAFTATRLANGKVLIVGGWSRANITVLTTSEVYDPANGAFSPTGALNIGRAYRTSTLLPNGKVLIAGGMDSSFGFQPAMELFDPEAETFTLSHSFPVARLQPTATLLGDGTVLYAGGQDATLVFVRVVVLAGVTHRFSSDTVNEVFHHLRWTLFPEALLVTHTVLGQMSISWMMTLLLGGAVLIWGSLCGHADPAPGLARTAASVKCGA
jgi:hypothetical protein